MGTFLVTVTILVSAASSLSDVLSQIAKRYEALTGDRVQINAGASSTLARQLIEGAPGDVFISADEAQMDAVAQRGLLRAGTRIALLRNELVVVIPAASVLHLEKAEDLAGAQVTRIAMANPLVVPAGVYGRRWLERRGLWRAIAGRVVPLPTVRAALAAVREGHVQAGIVYATDARGERGVRVAFAPPPADVDAIVYPAAVINGPRAVAAQRFLDFLQSTDAVNAFEAAGFGVVAKF